MFCQNSADYGKSLHIRCVLAANQSAFAAYDAKAIRKSKILDENHCNDDSIVKIGFVRRSSTSFPLTCSHFFDSWNTPPPSTSKTVSESHCRIHLTEF